MVLIPGPVFCVFVNNVDSKTECILSHLGGDTKLAGGWGCCGKRPHASGEMD